jgi:CDP-glycerol glycerophosphotransferase (TagB/SpsB family)
MLTGRPVLSFAYDLDEYENEERGLFYDLEHVFPGAVCRDFGQLAAALEEFAQGGHPGDGDRELKLRMFFDHPDDSSSARVVARVRELYLGAPTP